MTVQADEEALSRHLDGEMDAAEHTRFAAALERDEHLAARYAAWQAQDRAVASAIEDLMAARPALEFPSVRGEPVVQLDAARARRKALASRLSGHRWALPAAVAACLALVLIASPLLMPQAGPGEFAALETLPAGQTTELADGRRLNAVLTFAVPDGRWCREFAVSDGTRGIACRRDGVWQTEAKSEGTPALSEAGGFATAGVAEDLAIEQAYARLGGSVPLGLEDERRVIQSGWTTAPQ
jgi:hypothetical protein